MKDYDKYCISSLTEIKNKIPSKSLGWKTKIGDSIYKYPINSDNPILRQSLHRETNIKTDLGGINVLISDHFFLFWL